MHDGTSHEHTDERVRSWPIIPARFVTSRSAFPTTPRAPCIWRARAGRRASSARVAAGATGGAWPSRTPLTFGCKGCGKETSVTAGTVMHRTHLPLSVWFWAAYLVATHSNGMSAKQLQSELAIASYGTAWLLAMKLRAAMIAPERTPLCGLVETA